MGVRKDHRLLLPSARWHIPMREGILPVWLPSAQLRHTQNLLINIGKAKRGDRKKFSTERATGIKKLLPSHPSQPLPSLCQSGFQFLLPCLSPSPIERLTQSLARERPSQNAESCVEMFCLFSFPKTASRIFAQELCHVIFNPISPHKCKNAPSCFWCIILGKELCPFIKLKAKVGGENHARLENTVP